MKPQNKLQDAQIILSALGLPKAQQNEIACLTLLALCGLTPKVNWAEATRRSLTVSKGIMDFINVHYERKYAPNTRETFRRQVLHQFVQAGIVDYNPDSPSLPVNSPRAHYAISPEALEVIHSYGTKGWQESVTKFLSSVGSLSKRYSRQRKQNFIPVKLSNGKIIRLSSGKHNIVQAAIVKEFAARFAHGCEVLYLGDTANKDLYLDDAALKKLGVPIDEHSKLPDVILYDRKKNWVYLIEAVTSHGPVSPKRLIELEELLKRCKAGRIYVTAFPDFAEMKRHMANIAWETEIWIMEFPDHMIHYNGDKFIGPRQ